MKKSKNLSYFRIAAILLANIVCKNIFIFIFSLIYLFIVNKKEIILFLFVCILFIFNTYVLKDFINVGIVRQKNDNYLIVDSLLYKTKVYNANYEIGDLISLKNDSLKIDEDSYEKYNILYEYNDQTELISDKSFFKFAYKHLDNLDVKNKNICSKVLFNNYVSDDDLDIYLGFGFCFYYLLKLLFIKNKYIAIFLLILYSLFFGFQIKFILVLLDFLFSFFEIKNIDKLSIKLITIGLINHHLLLNYSIIISLIYSLLNCLNIDVSLASSFIQSYLFGSVNVFISYFYKSFVYLQTVLFCLSLALFISPKIEFLYLLISFITKIIKISSFSIRGKISFASAIVVLIVYKTLKKKYLLNLTLLLCLITPINNPLKHVSFIDVGQGDSTLIKGTFGTYNVLIDTGSEYNYSKLKRQLYNEGIYKIDYLIISHNDNDHNGNVNRLKNDFKIIEIIDYPIDIEIYNLYLKSIYLGQFDNDNDNSLIYSSKIDSYNFLFTGDISADAEHNLIKSGKIDNIDILKVAHHGSKYSSSDYFLRKTLPKIAIISTSGQYGHPHNEVIERLNKYKIDTYITRNDGTIIVYLTSILDFIKTSNNDFGIIIS